MAYFPADYKVVITLAIFLLLSISSSFSAAHKPVGYNNNPPPADQCSPESILSIINSTVQAAINKEARMGASLLRLHFHDCFVNGCDGSVLLDNTTSFTSEKYARPNNNSARGFEVIDQIKDKLEKQCPGRVSCADILAFAARESVVFLGGPTWNLKFERFDSKTAHFNEADSGSIPAPTSTLANLISRFGKLGLDSTDLVALSGAHTIGIARCTSFRARIYNDKNINSTFATERQGNCPKTSGSGDNNIAPLDSITPTNFDNNYFSKLTGQNGLLHSDQELFNGGSTDTIVKLYMNDPDAFKKAFAKAMIKMGNISLLTGNNGEIRKNCRVPNKK